MEEIFDISSTDFRRGNFKRRLLRIVVPIACVALMMASILGIALYSYSNNRRDALALSEDVLASLDRRIATEVRTFLSPASNLVKIVDRALAAPPPGVNRRDLAESLATQMLKSIPQLAIFSFADTGGNYMMLKKMPDRSIHTKIIQRGETGIKVTWIRRDPDGREIGREYPTDDTYDPRTRPWYSGAVSTTGVFWTGVYIFFTDQKPGITAAKALRNGKGELLGVIGLDIELTSLSAFLGSLQIGRSGRAMIIGSGGGRDIITAKTSGDWRVDAVEINEGIVRLMLTEYADFSGQAYRQPGTTIRTVDGRTAIEQATGDLEFLREIYPCVKKQGDNFENMLDPDGLLNTHAWPLPDPGGGL